MLAAPPVLEYPEDPPKPKGFLARRMHLVRFAAFAVAAMGINLLTQNAVLNLLAGHWFTVYAALVCGTGSGLVFKYIVDKNWVFEDQTRTLTDNSRKFAIYTATGILTTVIFWGVELTFHYAFGTHAMTVLGGVIGLTIGYVVKYNLDKHLTFRAASPP
jgi:putative flippase GtrA